MCDDSRHIDIAVDFEFTGLGVGGLLGVNAVAPGNSRRRRRGIGQRRAQRPHGGSGEAANRDIGLPLRKLFDGPTVADVAKAIENVRWTVSQD